MNPEQRSAIYSLGLAVLVLVGGYGIVTESQVAQIAALLDAVLVAATAFWHRPTKNPSNQSGGTWGVLTEAAVDRNAPHGENPELIDDGDVR